MWTRALALAGCTAGSVAASETPLSAIDWLSRSIEVSTDRAPASALPGPVTVEPLRAPPEKIGYLSAKSIGLSDDLWLASQSTDLVALLGKMPEDLPLALRDALANLVALNAPANDPDRSFLLARIDTLLALGRIDAAGRLIKTAGTEDPAVFRRSFDIALLSESEDLGCQVLQSHPELSPTYPARIFCLARLGDWSAAALTLGTAVALGEVTEDDAAILSRFLDDGEGDLLPPPKRPKTVTPLVFRMYEAIGEPLATRGLPLAFAHSDLRHHNGWKTRIEAGERLYRAGAISGQTMLELYIERDPAASGGVWDRARAVQAWYRSKPSQERVLATKTAAQALDPLDISRLVDPPSNQFWAPPHDVSVAPDPELARLIAEGRRGEAALGAIVMASEAWNGDTDDLSRALATLRAVGYAPIPQDQPDPRWASR